MNGKREVGKVMERAQASSMARQRRRSRGPLTATSTSPRWLCFDGGAALLAWGASAPLAAADPARQLATLQSSWARRGFPSASVA